ncbi:isopeptide-forming domain-containing fimbrial protein [Actinoplanes sp. NPDC023801]|uniref:beta strand repeat-containing protein n=1 Tax=Actinoplanes sp. NPDC023801 TaxID=3154595 RepID=UPI0033CF4AEB
MGTRALPGLAGRVGTAFFVFSMILVLSLVLPFRATPAVAAQTICPTAVSLTNGDFEQPVISANAVSIMLETLVPGWLTTATDSMIELWRGFSGVAPASGSQHAELNANMVSTLYQDLNTTPGQILRWQLKHRGRSGTDTMAVVIGPPNGTLVQQGANISDGKTAWGSYTGTYTVPAGQTKTRFAFKSVASASPDPSVGNFIDAISFGSAGCLTTTTTVANAAGTSTANIGDTLTYTVTARNDGGSPATLSALTDTLPAGTTYVPGSLRSVKGATTTKPTDTSGDDAGEYVSGSRTLNLRVGTGATSSAGGTLAPGESQTMSYQVTVNSALAGTTLNNDANATYTETVTNTSPTSTSNSVGIVVNPAADLSVTAALASSAVVAGTPVSYTVTATNAGPSTAASAVLTTTVPAGLTGVTATSAGGTCTVTGTKAECTYASLATAATRTMTISGNVPSGATPGTAYTLGASITSATFEPRQSDNSASVSTPVTASADLEVGMTYSPANPVGGQTITYTATVKNNGPSTARNIVLSDPIPLGSTGASGSIPGGTCVNTTTGTIECSLASLAAGATTTATITMTLGNRVTNAVSIKSDTPDPDVNNNVATVTGTSVNSADVSISIALSKYTAYVGETITYTLTVKNNSPYGLGTVAENVSFIPVLPPGMRIVRDTTGPFAAYCTATACTIPQLPGGATLPITGSVVLEPDAQAGPGAATVTVITSSTDPVPGNNKNTQNFTVLLSGDLSVTQTLTNPDRPGGNLVPGERARSVVTVTNAGPTRAEGILVQRPVPAGQVVPGASTSGGSCAFQGTVNPDGVTPDGGVFICTRALMYASDTWTITFDSVLQPGYAGTAFARTVTVSSTSPDPSAANDSVTTTATVDHIADLALSQTTSTPQVVASDPVQFTVGISNSGPSDARNVVVQVSPQTGLLISAGSGTGTYDADNGRWSIPVVAAGGSATLTLTGTAFIAGSPNNVVRVLSADSTDPAAGNNTAQTAVTITPATASLRITAAMAVSPASRQNAALATDQVTYRFTVVNDGNVTMSQLVVRDALTGVANCPGTTLAPGAQMVCTSTTPYTITQADFDAQQPVYNNATATARPPGGAAAVTFGPAPVTVPLATGTASLKAVVTAAVSPAGHTGAAQAGDSVTYTYVVTNDGNAALEQVAVTDTHGGAVNCPGTRLGVGASMICTSGSPYTVTQSDVDAGVPFRDAATLSGALTGSSVVRTFGPFSTGVAVAAATPSLTAVVTASVTPPARQSAAARNDTIGYSYAVTNNGNVTMSSINVTDTRTGTAGCPATTLAVNATMTCTSVSPYTVTQADLDAGIAILDSTTVTGRAPGAATSSYGPFTASVPVAVPAPALAVAVVPTVTPIARQNAVRAGDTIAYAYTVTNNGNVTMSTIGVIDTRLGPATCSTTVLGAGATATCTATTSYTVTQADVDLGIGIVANASVNGRPPAAAGNTVYGSGSATVPVATASASLSVTAVATVSPAAHQSAVRAGDTIAYTYTVVNDGNVTMGGIVLNDALAGAINCPASSLAVGATMTCTSAVVFPVTQARIDAGVPITASTTATATTPGGGSPSFGPFTVTVGVAPAVPALNMMVTALVDPAARQNQAQAGDTITYRYDVSNTGNVTMSSIAVADTLAGGGTCPGTTLAVGASMVCTSAGDRTVTQNEIDNGVPSITNAATLTARAPGAGVSSVYATGSDTVALARGVASLTVSITPAVNPSGNRYAAALGNTVTHSLLVTNNGFFTMSTISLADSLTGPVTCPQTSLAVGASMVCSTGAAHVVSQNDLDTGGPITSNITVMAQSPGDGAPQPYGTFTATVPVAPANPLLQLTAAAATPAGNTLGKAVVFSYTVSNIGNVTMEALVVSGSAAGTATCDFNTLAPGGNATCTGGTTVTIDQGHIDAGLAISDTSQAVAQRRHTTTALTFGPRTASAAVVAAAPSATISTNVSVPHPNAEAGDTIAYSYTVTNDGNVTMDNFSVTDSLIGTVTCTGLSLTPGQSAICPGGSYPVTQAHIDAGQPILSEAYLLGRQIGMPAPQSYGPDTSSTPVAPAAPSLAAVVTAVVSPAANQLAAETGDTVRYRTVLTNDGNQTITGIGVSDPRSGTATCPGTTLAPNDSMTCLSTSPYTVTANDIDGNVPVATTVTVAGSTPGAPSGTLLTRQADFPVVSASPALTIAATAAVTPAGHHDQLVLNDSIAYRFTVRNTGNRTMTGIVVSATRTGTASCPATTLAVGASTTCTSGTPYVVTQPDVEAGQPITETASVTARAFGTTVDLTFGPAAATEQMATPADSLDLAVTATVAPAAHQIAARVGDTVSYRYTVTNDGDVQVSGIAVDDALVGAATCGVTSLAPGASTTCTGGRAYRVTQADVDADRAIREPATVTGRRPGAPADTEYDQDAATVRLVAGHGRLDIAIAAVIERRGVRAAAATDDAKPAVGDGIRYHYTVVNNGNVTMSGVTLVDDRTGPVPCPQATLTVFESMTCTATNLHYVTQADVDNNRLITTTATVSGLEPGATTPYLSGPAQVDTPVEPPAPAVDAEQEASWADTDGDGTLSPADDVTSTIEVVNSGNVTLYNVVLSGLPVGVTCPRTTLAPGERMTCVSDAYHLSAADIAAGQLTFVVHADASTPSSPSGVRADAPASIDPPTPSPSASSPGSPSPSVSSSASPAASPSRSPSVSPSPGRSPSVSPTRSPTRSPSRSAAPTRSPAVRPSPTRAADPGPGENPITGGDHSMLLGAGFLLLGAGVALLMVTGHRGRHARRWPSR